MDVVPYYLFIVGNILYNSTKDRKGESHMRKYGLFSVMIFITLTLILVACGGKESKEDVIDSVKEHMDEVEEYHTEFDLDITVHVDGNLYSESGSSLNITMNEKTLENSGVSTQDDQELEYYSTEEATYAQVNDTGWEDVTAQEDDYKSIESNYKSVAQVLIDLKDVEDLEMEKEDDAFVFTFTGNSEDVFKAFEKPYDLQVQGVELEDFEHDFTIVVDSETYFIEEIQSDMSVEVDNEKLAIAIAHTYDKINDIEDIEIPEEVLAAVEGTNGGIEGEGNQGGNNEGNLGGNNGGNQGGNNEGNLGGNNGGNLGGNNEGNLGGNNEGNQGGNNEGNLGNNTPTDGSLEQRVFVAQEMGMEMMLTYYYTGDKVIKQISETIISYEAVGVTSKEQAKEMLEPQVEQMQGVDGLISRMEFYDDQLVEYMEVNYETLDFDKARNLPGIMFDDAAETTGVSMEKSAQMLRGQGYTEVE